VSSNQRHLLSLLLDGAFVKKWGIHGFASNATDEKSKIMIRMTN
jgi:hypothetical protein